MLDLCIASNNSTVYAADHQQHVILQGMHAVVAPHPSGSITVYAASLCNTSCGLRMTLYFRSSEWGVMPFHWYFTSALPRALLGGLPLAGMGVFLEPRIRSFIAIVTAYVVLYSFLPHKEVCFGAMGCCPCCIAA